MRVVTRSGSGTRPAYWPSGQEPWTEPHAASPNKAVKISKNASSMDAGARLGIAVYRTGMIILLFRI